MNLSVLDIDVRYIFFFGELDLIIRSDLNDFINRIDFILDYNFFSLIKEFKIIV